MNSVPIALQVNVPGEAKIADLELIGLGTDEQILWLDVSMHDVLRMKVIDCFQ